MRHRRKPLGITCFFALVFVMVVLSYASVVVHRTESLRRYYESCNLRSKARFAAESALAVVLREVHTPSPDLRTKRQYQFEEGNSATVTFSFGDNSTPSHLSYERPYRLSLRIEGEVKAGGTTRTHPVEVVLQLVRRTLGESPEFWSEVRDNEFCSWGSKWSQLDGPLKLHGNTRLAGRTFLFTTLKDEVRKRFLTDLLLETQDSNSLLVPGPVDLGPGDLQTSHATDLQTNYGATVNLVPYLAEIPSTDWSTTHTYTLYPGGKIYSIPLAMSIADLGSAESNPLRLAHAENGFSYAGAMQAMFLADAARITGQSQFRAVELPPLLHSSTTKVTLPTLIANHLRITTFGQLVSNSGIVTNKLQIDSSPNANRYPRLSSRGPLVVNGTWADPHPNWQKSKDEWNALLAQFLLEEAASSSKLSFPAWLEQNHQVSTDHLTLDIQPSSNYQHHPKAGMPVFGVHPDDAGLVWDVVRKTAPDS